MRWRSIALIALGCGKTTANADDSNTAPDAADAAAIAADAGIDVAPDATVCTVTVATAARLSEVLRTYGAPALVCLEPGDYEGPFELRDSVDILGLAPGVRVTGLEAEAATDNGVTLSNLEIRGLWVGRFNAAAAPVRLRVSGSTLAEMQLYTAGAGRLEVEIVASVVAQSALLISHDYSGSRADTRIVIERSRCDACYPLVDLRLWDSTDAILPPGSRVDVDIANNVIADAQLESVRASFLVTMLPEDLAVSRFWLRHNTVVNGIGAYGLDADHDAIILANNVEIDALLKPMPGGTRLGNLSGTLESGASAWFSDYAGGNYEPSANSPLLGSALPEYATNLDQRGNARDATPDLGAIERVPP